MIVLALILLTSLDGSPVWVESTQISIIRPARESGEHQCQHGVGAGLRVGGSTLCVKETPAQIQEKIRNAD